MKYAVDALTASEADDSNRTCESDSRLTPVDEDIRQNSLQRGQYTTRNDVSVISVYVATRSSKKPLS